MRELYITGERRRVVTPAFLRVTEKVTTWNNAIMKRTVGMTLALAAIMGTLIVPSYAQQKNGEAERAKKADAAATTKFITQKQADKVKGVDKKASERKAEEDAALGPMEPKLPADAKDQPKEGEVPPQEGQAPAEGQQPTQPAPEPPKEEGPKWRLKGIVWSKEKPGLAMFDTGKEHLSPIRAGDKLDEQTVVVSVSENSVIVKSGEKTYDVAPW